MQRRTTADPTRPRRPLFGGLTISPMRVLGVLAAVSAVALVLLGLVVERATSRVVDNPPRPPASAAWGPGQGTPIFFGDPERLERPTPRPRSVALTFDDGPHPVWTPKILDVLDRYGVKATFFILGEKALERPDLVAEIVRRGHEVGNHTHSHPAMGEIPGWEQRLQLKLSQSAIIAATGVTPTSYRPPFSSKPEWATGSELSAAQVAGEAGLATVFTNAPTQDWNPDWSVADIVRNATTNVRPGWVITMHDGGSGSRARTVAATEQIIQRLKTDDRTFTTVSGLGRGVTTWSASAPARAKVESFVLVSFLEGMEFSAQLARWVHYALFTLMLLFIVRNLGSLVFFVVYLRRGGSRYGDGPGPQAVTVVVPAYNEELGIVDSVLSILDTELPEVEVIVVDDGSTDRTAQVVEELGLSRVRVIRQANAGKAAALQRGAQEATHETIVMVDADSVFEPTTLPELMKPLSDPRVGAVAGNVRVANRRGLLGRFQHVEYTLGSAVDRRAMDALGFVLIIPGAVGAFRRTALDEIGGVPLNTLCEDYDLTMGLQRAGWHVAFAAKAFAHTEVPMEVKSLYRQRYRWMFGTLQVLWKHRSALLLRDRRRLWGPLALVYGFLLGPIGISLLPFIGVFVAHGILLGDTTNLVVGTGLLALVMALVGAGLAVERDRFRDLPLVMLQLPYTSVLTFGALLVAIKNAAVGLRPQWKINTRRGIGQLLAEQGARDR